MSGESDLESAVAALGMRPTGSKISISEVSDWYMSGSETYLYVFEISQDGDNQSDTYVFKSLIPYPGTMTVSEAVDARIARRSLLREFNVPVVDIYAHHSGTILEDFVPFTVRDAFNRAHHTRKLTEVPLKDELIAGSSEPFWQIAFDILYLAAVVDELRFASIGLISDLRSNGERAIAVDFGQDLGPPFIAGANDASRRDAVQWLLSQGMDRAGKEYEALWEAVNTKLDFNLARFRGADG